MLPKMNTLSNINLFTLIDKETSTMGPQRVLCTSHVTFSVSIGNSKIQSTIFHENTANCVPSRDHEGPTFYFPNSNNSCFYLCNYMQCNMFVEDSWVGPGTKTLKFEPATSKNAQVNIRFVQVRLLALTLCIYIDKLGGLNKTYVRRHLIKGE